MLETLNFVRKYTHIEFQKIYRLVPALIILLMLAFFLQKRQHFLAKIILLLKGTV